MQHPTLSRSGGPRPNFLRKCKMPGSTVHVMGPPRDWCALRLPYPVHAGWLLSGFQGQLRGGAGKGNCKGKPKGKGLAEAEPYSFLVQNRGTSPEAASTLTEELCELKALVRK